MKKNILIYILAASLVLNILLGIALVLMIPALRSQPDTPPEVTLPTSAMQDVPEDPTTAPPETAVPTQPPQTEPVQTVPPQTDPPETKPPVTQPPATQPPATEPKEEYIGKLYTRKELEKLDNTLIPYGPGTAKNGEPAPYAGPAQKQYGKYGGHFIEDNDGVIYMTFDCGYEYFVKDSAGNNVPLTGMILDTLKEKGVKAVFFVTMSYVKSNPDLVQRMIDEGHAVGNHSANHHSMPSLTIDRMVEEIMTLHDYVKNHFGYAMNLFRPPSGEFSVRSLAVTQSLGYETVHWSFAYADWDTAKQPDPATALDKILSCHHDGAIYLLHAVSETNTQVLGDVIDGLRNRGYTLELLAP